ncbi:MAG TPA: dihydrofolate reductase [Rhodopseudomonas sp.]|uniref:dihydrofolate reductase n=1 Tax=Rhodopseudomonas sp. TaxID=1078 RepID=UPI002ED862D4
MLADARHVMPEALKFPGDQRFFLAALERAALIVHGRHSYEDQPNSARRKRLVATRSIAALAPDPSNRNGTLWNPAGAAFEQGCKAAGVDAGSVAIIGGPEVFALFFDRFDTFWLSRAPQVRLPDGEPCFPGVPEHTPEQILAAHGLRACEAEMLDEAAGVSVTAWRRATPS